MEIAANGRFKPILWTAIPEAKNGRLEIVSDKLSGEQCD